MRPRLLDGSGRSTEPALSATTALVIVATLVVWGLPGAAAGQAAADSVALLDYVAAYQETWNTRDAAAVAAYFTEDADLVMGTQPVARGRPAIEDSWRAYFDVQEPGRRGRFDVTSLRRLAPGAALLDVWSTTAGEGLVTREARGTWLLRSQGGRWLIVAMRGQPTEADEVELVASRRAAQELRPGIRAFVAAYEDAFNSHDPDALAGFYRSDADLIVREQPAVRGAPAIRDWWAAYFDRPRPYRALMVIDRIVMVTDRVALLNVIGTGATPEPSEELEPVRTARATWVLAREDGGWLIAAMRVLPGESDRLLRASARDPRQPPR